MIYLWIGIQLFKILRKLTLKLHKPMDSHLDYCAHCKESWPCTSIRNVTTGDMVDAK